MVLLLIANDPKPLCSSPVVEREKYESNSGVRERALTLVEILMLSQLSFNKTNRSTSDFVANSDFRYRKLDRS